jgi:uncharacterized membrane protein YvbJ
VLSLLKELCSKETWERTLFFTRRKTIEEGKKPLTKKDILPLILAFIICIGIVFLILFFVNVLEIVGIKFK